MVLKSHLVFCVSAHRQGSCFSVVSHPTHPHTHSWKNVMEPCVHQLGWWTQAVQGPHGNWRHFQGYLWGQTIFKMTLNTLFAFFTFFHECTLEFSRACMTYGGVVVLTASGICDCEVLRFKNFKVCFLI